ncbi:MAG: hypothetical protein ABW069_13810 [Duganella sp.]
MTLEKTGEWRLDTGTWHVHDLADGNDGPQLVRTRLGHDVAPELQPADIAALMQTRGVAGVAGAQAGTALYPPEFRHSPVTGAALAAVPGPARAWIPPFGARPVRSVTQANVVGLRQSAAPLHLHAKAGYHAETDPAARMPLPPSGDYQFFSSRFGTHGNGLLALDPEKGSLFAWLPASARWAPLHGAGGAQGTHGIFLAESGLPHAAWRAELHQDFNSRLFVATDAGLACVTPDLAALQYAVRYAGDGPAVGAPLVFQDQVWAPVQQGIDGVALTGMDADGQPGAPVLLANVPPLRDMGAPVSYGRTAIWPCAAGQLVLQRKPDGGFAAQFIAWPPGLAPQFAFGSPYLARDGDLWQLCFDSHQGTYAYVALGKTTVEIQPAQGPRLSSGAMNYRFATKHHQAPWDEPEHGDDGATSAVVIPLLEVGPRSTIGVKFSSTAAVADTLRLTERMRVQLVWDDNDGETVFNTSVLPQPWALRLFVHDGKVWAYHPELKDILGWDLTA